MIKESLSWIAPIIPSVSLGGIPLGIAAADLNSLLKGYLIDSTKGLYRFEMSPILQLKISKSVEDEIYLFNVYDRELINWRLYFNSPDHVGANPRALAVVVRKGKVHAVKVWNFEHTKDGCRPRHIYGGKLPEGVGLGDSISDFLRHAHLNYDDAEEVFYTGTEYGGLEITGCGDPEKYLEQSITALTVIPASDN